jgi:hypothetical protein
MTAFRILPVKSHALIVNTANNYNIVGGMSMEQYRVLTEVAQQHQVAMTKLQTDARSDYLRDLFTAEKVVGVVPACREMYFLKISNEVLASIAEGQEYADAVIKQQPHSPDVYLIEHRIKVVVTKHPTAIGFQAVPCADLDQAIDYQYTYGSRILN